MKGRVEIIIGAQWGDEGKGRVVDALGNRVEVFARYQGGANAGHTVIVEGEKYVFHLLPSGMLYPCKLCAIGNGVVVDPEQLINELKTLQEQGKDRARLIISGSAHVVMPYHKILDKADEQFRSKDKKIGTTGRGIGPCYVDKFNRCGIRIEDLLDPEILREKLSFNLDLKNLILTKVYNAEPVAFDDVYAQALSWGETLAPYVADVSLALQEAMLEGKGVLFEGAQGTLLDVDHGTYPFVTSSSPIAAGGCVGLGVGPSDVDRVIGVVKAYCTRVGEGPFPTEDLGNDGQTLRDKGGEYGATTGRPRRCGWLDLVALKYAVRVNGMTSIALTKLDVLTGFDKIKVCTHYEANGKKYENYLTNTSLLEKATPVYTTLDGWKEDLSACRNFDDLPETARKYVEYIEKETGVPVQLIGVGPGRDQTIIRGL
ncbi:MAG: adenylosuccinate synthase [Aminobacterium sp.]|uniref:adenylosuccinate synthase n=1 Tax=unclassified Aminobacterium TaxID=2685012 RepID=UPI001BD02917|nr:MULTISPECIES: adenylosuccinate synthase [unclassified Aminobacterium]MDD2206208.1 adenylosuccinate synthase [Aminobacterium sp.]MDD3425828.1 adenylosuccinate synthase [Aminobacterium sp.]MDD3707646.1 adenylosuccinate synthase [Aminobacterium sp.]MDD4227948.1 adenylosuccinate synthase [Aminobacterium sp.]MDD4551205.1 adenylosuccinate synthase [Aminobacterium sp.]